VVKFLALVILLTAFPGCVTRSRLNAYLWFGIAIPEDICEKTPEIKEYGVYRRLNDGRFEFVSICSDEYEQFFSMRKTDLERLLNGKGRKESSK